MAYDMDLRFKIKYINHHVKRYVHVVIEYRELFVNLYVVSFSIYW